MPNKIDFSFSDTIGGYITKSDPAKGTFRFEKGKGEPVEAELVEEEEAAAR